MDRRTGTIAGALAVVAAFASQLPQYAAADDLGETPQQAISTSSAPDRLRITSVTPIAAVNSQYIIIRGKGFGNTPPMTSPLGDGSVDTLACTTPTPSLAIDDNAGVGWAAGRITCSNSDAIGVVVNGNPSPPFWWSDDLIVLWGFGSALGGNGPFQIAAGDPLSIKVFAPGNTAEATYNERVVSMTPPTRKNATVVTVQGIQGLADTGISVPAGAEVSIRAAGLVSFATDGRPLISPAGFPPNCNAMAPGASGFPAPDLPCISLVGQIGASGPIFEVGTRRRFVARQSGDLFLGVNDNVLGDNSGQWTVSVLVRR